MSPLFVRLLTIAVFATSALTLEDGFFTCNSETEHCCKPSKGNLPSSVAYDPLGKCFPRSQECPKDYNPYPSCGRFDPKAPPKCDHGCCISWASKTYPLLHQESLTQGLTYQCRAPGQPDCGPLFSGQVFNGDDCRKNFPNNNVKPQPRCGPKEYCCRQYATANADGLPTAGLETKCQAAGTGCPEGFVGSTDTDCNKNYPNWQEAPLPKMPVDCPNGKYACIEYAGHSKMRAFPGIATTCQEVNQGCPAHYEGFATNSFKGIWPSQTFEPAPRDCPDGEFCCMEPPYTSRGFPNARIGGTAAICRKGKGTRCPDEFRIAFATNKCSTLVPNFNNNTVAY